MSKDKLLSEEELQKTVLAMFTTEDPRRVMTIADELVLENLMNLIEQYALSKQIEELESTRVIKYGKTYSDATDWKHEVEMCEEDTGNRILELHKQQEELK